MKKNIIFLIIPILFTFMTGFISYNPETNVNITGGSYNGTIGASTPSTGIFTTLSTGQGAYELYKMNQDVDTTAAPSFVGVSATTVTASIVGNVNGNLTGSVLTPSQTSITTLGSLTSINTIGTITSTLAAGSAPFVVISGTKVSSLNVDAVDGFSLNQDVLTTSRPVFAGVDAGAGTVTASSFVGALTGNADTATNALQWSGTNTNLVVATAKSSLGLLDMAEQASNNVTISGGTITGTTITLSNVILNNVTVNSIVDTSSAWGQWYVTYNVVTFVPTQAYSTYNIGILVKATENITAGSDGIATINVTGFYTIVCDLNFSKETGGDDIEGGISINGANPDAENEFRDDNTTTGFNNSHCTMFRKLTAGDRVSLKIKNITSNSRYITLRSSKFNIIKQIK